MELRETRWAALTARAEQQHGVFTPAQAASAGIPVGSLRRWVASQRVSRIMQGAYAVPRLVDDWTRHAAICMTVASAVVSHRAAARWWALDPIEHSWPSDLSVPDGRATRRQPLRRPTALLPADIRRAGVLRITTPTRTLVDLGAVVSPDHLERAVESALRQRLTSVERLRARARELASKGRSGPRPLLDLLETHPANVRPTGSDAEVRFLQLLRRAGIEAPERQLRVMLPSGSAFLDCGWAEQRVFVEIDGWETHSRRSQFQRDRTRQNELVVLQWTPLRFTVADIDHRSAWVVATVKQALAVRPVAALLRPSNRLRRDG